MKKDELIRELMHLITFNKILISKALERAYEAGAECPSCAIEKHCPGCSDDCHALDSRKED
jgi:hypothetical protein